DHLLAGYARMQGSDDEFIGAGFRLHDAQVGDDAHRPFARQPELLAVLAALPETDRGDERQLVDEGAMRLLEDDQHLPGRAGNFRRPTRPWQANFRLVIVADHRGVDIAVPVDLRRAEK